MEQNTTTTTTTTTTQLNKHYPVVKNKRKFTKELLEGNNNNNGKSNSNNARYDPEMVQNKNEELDKLMDSYDRHIKISSVSDFFTLSKRRELPNEEHEFATVCNESLIILKSILIHGFVDDKMTNEEFKITMMTIMNLFKSYRLVKYQDLKELALLNRTNKWSLSSITFLIELHILLILDKFNLKPFENDNDSDDSDNDDDDESDNESSNITSIDHNNNKNNNNNNKYIIDYDKLKQFELICFSNKPIREYTQNEIIITMQSLSENWRHVNNTNNNSINGYKIFDKYINLLELRVAELSILHFDETVLDGRDRQEKVFVKTIIGSGTTDKQKTNRNINLFAASFEFITNMSSIISHFQIGLKVRDRLITLTPNKSPVTLTYNYWNNTRYAPYLIAGFRSWAKRNVSIMQAAKFRDKIKKTVFNYSLRLGEDETYSRNNGGISTKNILSIIEQTRTPLQNAYFNLELLPIDISSILPSFQNASVSTPFEYNYIGSIITALVFRYHCESDMVFDWWMFNFLDDLEYFQQDKVLHGWRKEPFIIHYFSEFNIWFNGKLYLTKEIDIALILWTVIMVDKLKCKFVTTSKIFQLTNLRNLLNAWEAEGKTIVEDMNSKHQSNKYVIATPTTVPVNNDNNKNDDDDDEDDEQMDDSATNSLLYASVSDGDNNINNNNNDDTAILQPIIKYKNLDSIQSEMCVDISQL